MITTTMIGIGLGVGAWFLGLGIAEIQVFIENYYSMQEQIIDYQQIISELSTMNLNQYNLIDELQADVVQFNNLADVYRGKSIQLLTANNEQLYKLIDAYTEIEDLKREIDDLKGQIVKLKFNSNIKLIND